MTGTPLRIVALNAFLPGYRLVADWAEREGHEIVLVVTPPIGANRRYDESANPFVLDLPSGTDVLVTGKLRAVAAPVIASLQPDLVISAAFPRLIPPEILSIPKHGAINLHPSSLPAGRGRTRSGWSTRGRPRSAPPCTAPSATSTPARS